MRGACEGGAGAGVGMARVGYGVVRSAVGSREDRQGVVGGGMNGCDGGEYVVIVGGSCALRLGWAGLVVGCWLVVWWGDGRGTSLITFAQRYFCWWFKAQVNGQGSAILLLIGWLLTSQWQSMAR
jgi:hypothetical protein